MGVPPVYRFIELLDYQLGNPVSGRSPWTSADFIALALRSWPPRPLRSALGLKCVQAHAESASVAPKVTPLARIPANGAEMNQSFAKQVLDRGVYGVIWPHVATVEQAYNAVASDKPSIGRLYVHQRKPVQLLVCSAIEHRRTF